MPTTRQAKRKQVAEEDLTMSKRPSHKFGGADQLVTENGASGRRKLTSRGPKAAYDQLQASQSFRSQGSFSFGTGIPATIPAASSDGQGRPVTEKEVNSPGVSEGERQSLSKRKSMREPVRRRESVRQPKSKNGAEADDGRGQGQVDAFDRLEMLETQVKEYKQTLLNMQKLQNKVAELPRHCRWECVSKVLTDVVSNLMLGNESECTMHPTETELIPRILSSFGITMDQQNEVELFFTEWGKGAESSIMAKAFGNIRDRRGSILRVLREEFYAELGLPKPRDGEGDVYDQWRQKLAVFKRDKSWRISGKGDTLDPWGYPAVHHSIARVLMGIRYNRELPVTINIHQAGFFFYNLQLAIDGRVMEASRMNLHHKGMHEMEETLKKCRNNMKRIRVSD